MLSKKTITLVSLLLSSCSSLLFAAEMLDLNQQNFSQIQTWMSGNKLINHANDTEIIQLNQTTDFNQTKHIRIRQTYHGYPIWGAEAVLHIPLMENTQSIPMRTARIDQTKVTMDGVIYQHLDDDLKVTPPIVFTIDQINKAYTQVLADFENKIKSRVDVKQKQTKIVIYIDADEKAHWAFYISFYINQQNLLAKPAYLVDAISLKPYEVWDEVKSLGDDGDAAYNEMDEIISPEKNLHMMLQKVKAGGFGGNKKMGKLSYDGSQNHLPSLDILRDPVHAVCYLSNDEVLVADYLTNEIVQFPCQKLNKEYKNLYWDGELSAVNDGFSPGNDALYAGKQINAMYQKWYGIAPLVDQNNKPMVMEMIIHSPNYNQFHMPNPDNARWSPVDQKMYFGDGKYTFYPLTSLGVAAHEISHGFTEHYSQLHYNKQSGGLNEAFSDMAAQAAEYFAQGKNSWQIGSEITKERYTALRYMDEPSRDCYGDHKDRGMDCSLDTMRDYDAYTIIHRLDYDAKTRYPNVHYSSGIFNRAFYYLAKAKDWNVKKAFDVMVQANRFYWTSDTTFPRAACGVMKAAKDYKYPLDGVVNAFRMVDIDVRRCTR